MTERKYDQAKGWYLDLNSNGDICWFNLDSGEQGDCYQARDGGSEFSDDLDPMDICLDCPYFEDCEEAGCGCLAP